MLTENGLVGLVIYTAIWLLLLADTWSMPKIDRTFWFIMLASNLPSVMSASLEYSKTLWFIWAMILVQKAGAARNLSALARPLPGRVAFQPPYTFSKVPKAPMQSGEIRVPAAAMGAAAGSIGIKEVALLCCTLLVCGCLHLFFPDRIENWKSARLGSLLSYPYNTDSGEYAFLVVTFPHGLKQHEAPFSGRFTPGLAFLVYQPLRLLERWIPEKICRQAAVLTAEGGGTSVWKKVDLRNMVTAWAALIVVNVVLYMTSLLLILSSLRRVFPPSLALLLTMVTATQRNAIDFLLVPATDVFNVLLPAIFLYTAIRPVVEETRRTGHGADLGGGRAWKRGLVPLLQLALRTSRRRDWHAAGGRRLLCTSLFALPTLLYLGLAWLTGLTNWSHNVNVARDRDFIWMIDDLRKGMFAEIPLRWLSSLGTHLRQFVVGWPVPLVLCAVLALQKTWLPSSWAQFEATPRFLRRRRCRVLCFGAVPLPPLEHLLLSGNGRLAGRPGDAETRPAGHRAAVGSRRPDVRLCRR